MHVPGESIQGVPPISISIHPPEHSLDGSHVAVCAAAAAAGRRRSGLWLDAGACRHGLPVVQQAQVLQNRRQIGRRGAGEGQSVGKVSLGHS